MDNPLTLQEAKDQVAEEIGYKNFEDLYQCWRGGQAPYSKIITVCDEASELYARSKWDEACEAQMKEVYKQILPDQITNAHAIKHWTQKPEFKP